MNEKKSTRKEKCFLKSLGNKNDKKDGTQIEVTESNICDETADAGSGIRMFVFVASCVIVLVCSVLLLKWNYSSPGVTVETQNNLVSSDDADNSGEENTPTIVNINTADKDQLMTLPGIGETLALRITEYREEHGEFKSIEEIMRVDGIGQKKFNDIAKLITVDMEESDENLSG